MDKETVSAVPAPEHSKYRGTKSKSRGPKFINDFSPEKACRA